MHSSAAEGLRAQADSLKANLETLETFKKRVDILLKDLQDSAAAPHEVREGALKASHLGAGFAEADSLFAAYSEVHDRLQQLSKTAADQIEAMGLLVHIANNDYQNVDQDEAARLWAIQRATDKRYRAAERDGAADAGKAGPQQETQQETQQESSTVGTEM